MKFVVAMWDPSKSVPELALLDGSPDAGILPDGHSRWGFEVSPPVAAGVGEGKQTSWGIQLGDRGPLFWVTGERTAAELVIITLTINDELQRAAMRIALRAPQINARYGDGKHTEHDNEMALAFTMWLGRAGVHALEAGQRPWVGERVATTPVPADTGETKKRPSFIKLVQGATTERKQP